MNTTKTRLTFDQFIDQYPEDGAIYELVDGEIREMRPIGAHENVANLIQRTMDREIERLNLGLVVTRTALVRTVTKEGQEQGRIPDVSVVDGEIWDRYLYTYQGFREPLRLAVEVTSTNWEDDYVDKLDEYGRLGISEYWIVDYLAIASRSYLGRSKVPTVFVYQLINGEYQSQVFRGKDRIISPTFPELELTVEQVVTASQPRIR
ncbi:MAG: Uma2 family endonuclease [Okeania sp. SIO2C9]|uniref:Uma2 family endonuclease n=1 Tax=Okeania sp. SIO2C9 TaxID=2607791 RepID=UPI0013BF1BC5|nr:Uma2 family endonuclease [Okeania sp. SIO2C9]NEQ74920.1 Uma2 family endonuclease [Okeania sp. SIO2C9]